MIQQTSISQVSALSEQLQKLVNHPDFLHHVDIEKHGQTTIFTFDTDVSNFDLILESQSVRLFQYDFVPSPDGTIDEFDVSFKQAHQIQSVQQFLDLIEHQSLHSQE